MDDLPGWCRQHLGSGPAEVLFRLRQTSDVVGVRLADGRQVVVKARADDGRAASCVAAQDLLASRGFPCARPLTGVVGVGSLAVHAEEFRPGGEMLHGDSPDVAVRYAEVFARLMAALAFTPATPLPAAPAAPSGSAPAASAPSVSVPAALSAAWPRSFSGAPIAPPLPNPRWVRWDHTGPGLWPATDDLDRRDQNAVPAPVTDTAARIRRRLLAAGLPCVLGHADFEAQNLRWRADGIWAVHDWDSLAWQPEAALVGAASGAFASAGPPTLAPVESSAAFMSAYQDFRGRAFTTAEREVAWAASLWLAAHNARWEALHGQEPASGTALRTQAADRLRLANA